MTTPESSTFDLQETVMVVYEGQQHPVPRCIADDDQKLRDAFAPIHPQLKEATIERKDGEPIQIRRKPGAKAASTPIDHLIAAPASINPAIALLHSNRKIAASDLVAELERSIADIECVDRSLLYLCRVDASVLPLKI